MADDAEFLEDIDAFIPRSAGLIRVLGQKYEVPYYHDLPLTKALPLLKIEEDAAGQPLTVQMEAAWRQLKELIPSLPDTAREKMGNTSIQRVLARAWRLANRPPEGEGDAAPSPSSAPSPATESSTGPPKPK